MKFLLLTSLTRPWVVFSATDNRGKDSHQMNHLKIKRLFKCDNYGASSFHTRLHRSTNTVEVPHAAFPIKLTPLPRRIIRTEAVKTSSGERRQQFEALKSL